LLEQILEKDPGLKWLAETPWFNQQYSITN